MFNGTRVPVKPSFDHLEEGDSIEIFLDDFLGVTREQAVALPEMTMSSIDEQPLQKKFTEIC